MGNLISLAKTPPVVMEYYNSIKELETSDANQAYDLQNRIMYCFAGKNKDDISGFSGINIYDNLTANDTITSNVYAQRLRKIINEDKLLKLDYYNLQSSTYSSQPVLTGKGEVELCQTKVEVIYLKNGIRLSPRIEYLGIVGNKIVSISNTELNLDAISLMLEAARLYTQKKYREAYSTYEKILSIEPNNMNALYRLGIMTVKGEGTKKNRKLAEQLFSRAMQVGIPKDFKSLDELWESLDELWELKNKIRDAYYYVTHTQVI